MNINEPAQEKAHLQKCQLILDRDPEKWWIQMVFTKGVKVGRAKIAFDKQKNSTSGSEIIDIFMQMR